MQALFKPASEFLKPSKQVSSANQELNQFFEGGLQWGGLYEWGVPLGQGGYEVILSFLNSVNLVEHNHFALWIHPNPELQIYAPAWACRDVPLSNLRFACSSEPLKELKPVFISGFFKFLILEAPKKLSRQDLAFLMHTARTHKQIIFLLRPYYLNERNGNVWAKMRLNCTYEHLERKHTVTSLRGKMGELCFSL